MAYIKRSIETELLRWKNSPYRKPLLLRGARQVGKSTVVREFGKQFDNFVEVNLEYRPRLAEIFKFDLDPKRICFELGAALQTRIIPGKTLLFIDEIQKSAEAIKSLWFFHEQLPELHVIAAGSLLEFALGETESFGVGRIRSVYMYPLSFDEFLSAQGYDDLITAKRQASADKPLSEALHDVLCQQLRHFYLLGGMPEVINTWLVSHDYMECSEVMGDIADAYFDDFVKYSPKINTDVLRSTLMSIPFQIGSKFKYSNIEGDIDTYKAKKALAALVKAGLIVPVTHTAANGSPLGGEENIKFRKYIFHDTGLMLHLQKIKPEELLTMDADSFVNKGNLAEMSVGLEMIKYNRPTMPPYLFYWHGKAASEVDESGHVVKLQAELDYVAEIDGGVVPVEVKAGGRGSMHSMRVFLNRKPNTKYGVRCALENFSAYNNIKVFPLYAVSSLMEL